MKYLNNKKLACESLTNDSTVEEFVAEISKGIASFIIDNRAAFSQDNAEAFKEFLDASQIESVSEQVAQMLEDPTLLEPLELPQEEETQSEEAPQQPEQGEADLDQSAPADDTDNVSQDVLDMIDLDEDAK